MSSIDPKYKLKRQLLCFTVKTGDILWRSKIILNSVNLPLEALPCLATYTFVWLSCCLYCFKYFKTARLECSVIALVSQQISRHDASCSGHETRRYMAATVMTLAANLNHGSSHDRWFTGRSLKKGHAKKWSRLLPPVLPSLKTDP